MKRLRACFVAALGSFASFVVAPLVAQSSVIDIDPLGPGTSLLYAVNNRGQAVGQAELGSSDNRRAILWHDGHLTDLGALPDYAQSGAAAINERGQIVGYVSDAFRARAVLWDGGRIIDLTPPRLVLVCGERHQQPGRHRRLLHAELWPCRRRAVARRHDEPARRAAGYLASTASGIDDSGVVVGTLSNYLEDRSIAFRWADGEMSALPLPPATANAFASAINARGTFVGTATGPIGASPEPVIWQGDGVVPLGSTWGTVLGSAWGINDRGDVVGMSFAISGFVWSAGAFRARSNPPTARSHKTSTRAVWRSASSSLRAVLRCTAPSGPRHSRGSRPSRPGQGGPMTLRTIGLMLAIVTFVAFPARPTAQDGRVGPQTIVDSRHARP